MADGDPEFQTLMDSEGALIKPVFVFFDTDSDGCLTAPEVISVLTMLGYAHPGVGFETKPKMDFKQMMLHIHLEKKKSKQSDVERHIRRTFHMIDKQYRGKVGPKELLDFLYSVDLKIPLDAVERIAELISVSEDMRFTENDLVEYVKMVRQDDAPPPREKTRSTSASTR